MSSGIYRYAAYGSNLHPVRLQKRVPSAKLVGVSSASGYDLRFNKRSSVDGSGKCNLRPSDATVMLAIFDIARAEKITLDRIEGLGEGYNELIIDDAKFGRCQAYVADATAIDDTIAPMDWYKEMVLQGCRYHRFADNYIDRIARVATTVDANSTRRLRQWQKVEEMRRVTAAHSA